MKIFVWGVHAAVRPLLWGCLGAHFSLGMASQTGEKMPFGQAPVLDRPCVAACRLPWRPLRLVAIWVWSRASVHPQGSSPRARAGPAD